MNTLPSIITSTLLPARAQTHQQTGHDHGPETVRLQADGAKSGSEIAGPRSTHPLQTAEAGPSIIDDVLESLAATDDASKPPSSTPGDLPTVQELFDAWGTDDARTDLNSDGVVNTDDFLALLQQLSEAEQADSETPVTLQEIFDAWGTADARADLNTDGTVNTDDVLSFLQQAIAEQNGGQSGPVTIQDLFDAWGTGDITADLTGDGTVNTDDFLSLLARMSGDAASGPPSRPVDVAATGRSDVNHDVQPVSERATGLSPSRLAGRLVDRLERAGFAQQPPTNIRALVGKLNLSSAVEAKVMQQLAAKYVNGLGIDLIG